MIWIPFALANAVAMTCVNIADSHIISKRMPSTAAYLLPVGFIQLLAALFMLAIFPFPANPGVVHLLVLLASGIFSATSTFITLNALKHGEVSRVIPVVISSPIFIALLSMPILGDKISLLGWLGIIMTVFGSILISLQREGGGKKARLQKSFIILVFACLMGALAGIGFKYSSEIYSFWNIEVVNGSCVAAVFFLYSARRSTIIELKKLKQRTHVLLLTVGTQIVAITGITLAFAAIQNGPVSLVYAVTNIRPVLLFLLTVIISRFNPAILNERLTKSIVLTRLVAVLIVTAGVIIIRLSV